MSRPQSMAASGALALLTVLAGGCASRIDIAPDEFITRYTSNIEVPNPAGTSLPSREFLGADEGLYRIADSIPSSQGGGLFGKRILWRCPVGELPKDFPAAYRPGDAILDGRPDSGHTYMIESYAPPVHGTAFPRPTATAPAKQE